MINNKIRTNFRFVVVGLLLVLSACKTQNIVQKTANNSVPESFNSLKDTANVSQMNWKEYFTDANLIKLIDLALENNQELHIMKQEVEISRNEIGAKKGEYLPFVGLQAGAGAEKVGRYTSQGANDATTPIHGTKENPEFLPDFMISTYATWEIDIWKKLRNAKKAAVNRYLSTVEGKNFMVTNLIAEIANSYYELLALDNQLAILKKNIHIQTDALKIVRLQKESARVTELAVRRFEAQMLHTKSIRFEIEQQIVETENRIHFLIGGFPQSIDREWKEFVNLEPEAIQVGVPSELLANRPDIKQAAMELEAAKLDIRVAKARFYPSVKLTAGLGYQAFNAKYIASTPESLIYSFAGDLTAPLINRRAIKADYYNANAKQIQAVYHYEQTILNAYVEVVNELSKIKNMKKSFHLKQKEVKALTESIIISNKLFSSARADYMEVLLTQRDALEAKFELIETKKNQMNAFVTIYKTLGGGWN